MKLKVGDMVKLVSGGCGCDTCRAAMEAFYEVESVIRDSIDTRLGTFGLAMKWEVLPHALENE